MKDRMSHLLRRMIGLVARAGWVPVIGRAVTEWAATDWAKESVESIQKQVALAVPSDRPWVVGQWLKFYRLSRSLIRDLEEEGLALAKAGKLPGWRVLTVRRRKLDPKVTHAVLVKLFGEAVAEEACPRTAGFTSLEKAIRKVATKGEGAMECDRAKLEIDKAGGMLDAGVSERLALEGEQLPADE